MACGKCNEPRPDILRSVIHTDHPCKNKCNDCTDECDVTPKECDCPYGHLSGTCVHYTGRDLFTAEIRNGDTFDAVMIKVEKRFEEIQKILVALQDENEELRNELEILKNSLSDVEECSNWSESES